MFQHLSNYCTKTATKDLITTNSTNTLKSLATTKLLYHCRQQSYQWMIIKIYIHYTALEVCELFATVGHNYAMNLQSL